MVKVLFGGDVITKENWSQLVARLKDLQNSPHGPFHILFLNGAVGSSPSTEVLQELAAIDIKIYSLNIPVLSADEIVEYSKVIETFPLKGKGIISVQANLTVAFFRNSMNEYGNQTREDEEIASIVSSMGYRGCDVLISNVWPSDVYQFLDQNELQSYQSLGLPMGGSRELADFNMTVRPRYHFSSAASFFQRTPFLHHSNFGASSSTVSAQQPKLYTRFITLAPVSESKDKEKKWLHALSLQPIIVMKAAELEEAPPVFTECPFIPVGKRLFSASVGDGDSQPAAKRMRAEVGQQDMGPSGADGTFFFGSKGHIGGVAASGQGGKPLNLVPPHPHATTLFVGGLLPDTNEQVLHKFMKNIRSIRRQAGKRFCFVEFTDHASAMFIVERSQRRAFKWDDRTLVIGWAYGSDSSAAQHNNPDSSQAISSHKTEEQRLQQMLEERQLIPPSDDANTLYIGNLPAFESEAALTDALQTVLSESAGITAVQSSAANHHHHQQQQHHAQFHFAFVDFVDYAHAMAVITRSLNERVYLQGRVLVIGWTKHSAKQPPQSLLLQEPPHPGCKVLYLGHVPTDVSSTQLQESLWTQLHWHLPQLETSSIVSVRKTVGRDYAFVDFTDVHTARSAFEVINQSQIVLQSPTAANSDPFTAAVTTTTTTTPASSSSSSSSSTTASTTLTAGWAKGRAADAENQSADCWFCLASPSVKVHLLVSVGHHAYAALPRGGLTSHHVLLCPIDCVPSRLHLSLEAKQELLKYLRAWEKYFASQGHILITYERCIRTRNSRDHMQIHCIPLPHEFLPNVESVFAQKIAEHGYTFHDIPSNVAVEDFVLQAEGGPYQEYFYIELPYEVLDEEGNGTGAVKRKKKVYLQEDVQQKSFLMSFGSEVVAHMMEKPERAFWKNCVVPEEEEAEIAEQLRAEFAPFDPSV